MIEAPVALREAVQMEALRGLAVPAGTQKSLPPWLFYDERGSQLFEQITQLPEYYLTRTERSIFEQFAGEIVSEGLGPLTIAELGAGTAAKTGILLRAALRRQPKLLYERNGAVHWLVHRQFLTRRSNRHPAQPAAAAAADRGLAVAGRRSRPMPQEECRIPPRRL